MSHVSVLIFDNCWLMQADKIATGHNADDIAETVLLNILRGDLPRLSRCAAIITGESYMSHA